MNKKLISALFAFACLFIAALPASAAVTQNDRIPFVQFVFVPCANAGAGELLIIGGTLHIVSKLTIDNAGGVHFSFHSQPQGASGIGQDTGDTYRAVGVTRGNTNISADGLPFVDTFVNNFNMIGTGGGVSFKSHATIHITVNANGDVTANVFNISVTCM